MTYKIRLVEKSDLSFITDIRNDIEVVNNLGTYLITNKDLQEKWYNSLLQDKSKMYFIFEKDNKRIGYCRCTDIDYINRSVCIGGDICKNYRGKGYGKEMYKLLFNMFFDQMNFNRLWLFVLDSNEIALKLYKKLGFVEEGRQRKAIYRNCTYHDYIMMSVLREEYRINTLF